MVIGHSEGGIVATHLANKYPKLIAGVGILAGEDPSQLFSLYEFAKEGIFFNKEGYSKEQRIDSLTKVWKEILSDPASTTKYFWGFTYLRWSSFLKKSAQEELADYTGKIFIAQGESDKNVFPLSAEVIYTSLLSKGKNVQLQLISNADHSFNISNDTKRNGWDEIIKSASNWLMEPNKVQR